MSFELFTPERVLRRQLPRAKGISCVVGATLAIWSAACGSGSSPSAPSSLPSRVVTITTNGVSPMEVMTAVGTRVTFINNDVIPHEIFGGPDPSRPDCNEIDAVGFITPGQSKQTAVFDRARTCEYHDHSLPSPSVRGRIVIQ